MLWRFGWKMMFLFHVEVIFPVPAVDFQGYIWRQTFDKHIIYIIQSYDYHILWLIYGYDYKIPKPWNNLRVEQGAWSGVYHYGFEFWVNCNHQPHRPMHSSAKIVLLLRGKDMRNPPEMVETTLSYHVLLSCYPVPTTPKITWRFPHKCPSSPPAPPLRCPDRQPRRKWVVPDGLGHDGTNWGILIFGHGDHGGMSQI